jgi:benzodiazapine receptor
MRLSLFLSVILLVSKDASSLTSLSQFKDLRSTPAASSRLGLQGRHSFLFTKDCPVQRRNTLELKATAAPWLWALGHVVGGATGTPIVMTGTKEKGWYNKIDLPSWTPPKALFGPVWTFLYACMGFAAAKIYYASEVATTRKQVALGAWVLHYGLNIVWAPVFFGLQRLRLGLIIGCLQLLSLSAVAVLYHSIEPMAAYLLIPYGGWLCFATRLNDEICKRNPTKLGYNEAKLQADLLKLQEKAAKYANGE